MVGFEDSVNMAEECKDPVRSFPRIMLTGLVITGVIYILVAITSTALVAPADLGESDTPLLDVVAVGAPSLPLDDIFPFIAMFAVANSALINMLMASRLLYGMANERVLPRPLGKVSGRRVPYVAIAFTSLIAVGLIAVISEDALPTLGGTTALLLLGVFTVVNIAALVLRRDRVDHDHFRAPTVLPVIGAVTCAFLVGPWTDRDTEQYVVAGVLLAVGVVLWAITRIVTGRRDPEDSLDLPEGGVVS